MILRARGFVKAREKRPKLEVEGQTRGNRGALGSALGA
jgi:hypothetical protein